MRTNNKAIKEFVGITLGVVAALAILFSQSFYYDYVAKADLEVASPASDDEGAETHDVLSISQDAVSSFIQVTLSQGLHFITNIYTSGTEIIARNIDQKIDFNSYFKTLFRLIISPNAP